MNEKEKKKLLGILEQMGYVETEDETADFVLFNTCTVRENANLKVYGHLGHLKKIKQKNPNMLIGLCGCMMQEKLVVKKIQESYRFVDIIFGTHNIFKLAEIMKRRVDSDSMIVDIWEDTDQIVEDLPSERKFSFKSGVNIMYGCNNFCSYCIVPYVRGRERSRNPKDIIREIEKLAAEGVVEVMLLGQNVNSYGKGLEAPMTFAQLLREIEKIEGILNGTTNFILTLMETDNLDFEEALTIADGLGYVEADASLDLDGKDAAHKICILAMNAFEIFFDFHKIQCTGIRDVTKKDIDYAKKLGYRIKLIAQAKKLENGYGIDVSPTLIGIKDMVANVNQAYNVVEITCNYLENVIFYGKGAGRYVTASAVVSDIIKTHQPTMWQYQYQYVEDIFPITYSKYYIRCDHPLDIDYDHIYITNPIELNDLKHQLQNESYNLLKVRG